MASTPRATISIQHVNQRVRTLGGIPEVEDIAFRIVMPRLSRVPSGMCTQRSDRVLYFTSSPKSFNPGLEPDIVVRPVSRMRTCAAILDVKYKQRVTARRPLPVNLYARAHCAPSRCGCACQSNTAMRSRCVARSRCGAPWSRRASRIGRGRSGRRLGWWSMIGVAVAMVRHMTVTAPHQPHRCWW